MRLRNSLRVRASERKMPLKADVVLRGVEKSNSLTTTSAFSGIFLSDARTRNEFLNLIK